MIYFFHRRGDTLRCESRHARDGLGYELVITEGRQSQIERFEDARAMENRQYELRHAWLLHGWRPDDPGDEMDERED